MSFKVSFYLILKAFENVDIHHIKTTRSKIHYFKQNALCLKYICYF